MSDSGKGQSSEILEEAAEKHEDQPGEITPDTQPVEKQPSDPEADGSDRVNSDG